MATSGTIGTTLIKTASVLERAVRRCGLPPTAITAETASIALEDLFTLLMSISSRGLNLWCVDKQLIALIEGQASYDLPSGSLEVLNLLHASPQRVSGTDTSSPTLYQTELDDSTTVVRVGIKFSVAQSVPFTIQSSTNGIVWTTHRTVAIAPAVGVWGWYDLDPGPTATFFRIAAAALSTVDDFYLATSTREIEITAFNRDDYANQPDKTVRSAISNNYFFEKLVTPRITLWPVPNDDTRHLVPFRYRQVQDVGALANELELPTRWFEAIIWHLALRLAFDLPGVTADRRTEIMQMASSMTFEVEGSETDSAPVYFVPRIGVYNK